MYDGTEVNLPEQDNSTGEKLLYELNYAGTCYIVSGIGTLTAP